LNRPKGHARQALTELRDKQREIKAELLTLLEKAQQPNISKGKLIDEIFKIYMKLK